ncbi:MAG: hypothetical protein AAB463_02810 [Patescibacteria group bacterium]
MSMFSRTIGSLVLALMLGAFFALPAEAAVVPCGKSTDTGEDAMCQTCHLVEAADTALRFVMFVAAPLVATILFVIAGFIRVIGATNTKSISQSNTLFSNAIIGLVVIMLAWMVVNTFLKFVAGNYFGTSVKWYEPITCTPDENIVLPSNQPTPSATVSTAPSSSVQQAAQRLIAQSGVSFSTGADCGAPNHAQGVIDAVAAGQMPPVCSPTCSCAPGGTSGTTTVDVRILDGLTALSQNGFRFVVTSLTTGRHSASSSHYSGRGADIVIVGGGSDWIGARDLLDARGGDAFCESTTGANVTDCARPPTDHIHWGL